jgi:hypothetical protein
MLSRYTPSAAPSRPGCTFATGADTYRYTRKVNAALNADLGQFDMWPLLPTFRMPMLAVMQPLG